MTAVNNTQVTILAGNDGSWLNAVAAAPQDALLALQPSGSVQMEDNGAPQAGLRLSVSMPGGAAGQRAAILVEGPQAQTFMSELLRFLGMNMPGMNMPGVETPAAQTAAAGDDFAELTLREREVLELVAQGYRNDQIARELVLSGKTVRNYVSNIFAKLGANSRGEAIVRARQAGFGQREAVH